VQLGWAVTGELEDGPDGGTARLEFSMRGSRRVAKVTLRAERRVGGDWKYLLLEVKGSGFEAISCADGAGIPAKRS
jgi:hypothetical protein